MRFRYLLFAAGFCSVFLFLPALSIGQTNTGGGTTAGFQVIFSRRVYKLRGASFQQIWTWNPSTGELRGLTNSLRSHFFPTCTWGKISFVSPETGRYNKLNLWSFDPASGDERMIGPAPESPIRAQTPGKGCDEFAKAGRLEACGKNEDLSVSRDGKQIGHFKIPTEYSVNSLEWSPEAKWLLVGERPPDYSGDDPQFDYYVVDLAKMQLIQAARAFDSLWLPGSDRIVFTTPKDMAQLMGSYERHKRFAKSEGEFLNVWVQQLVLFDPATGKSTAITSGLSNNFDASLCRL